MRPRCSRQPVRCSCRCRLTTGKSPRWGRPRIARSPLVSRPTRPDVRAGRRFDASAHPALVYGAAVARGSGWVQAVTLAEKLDAPVWAAPSSERAPFPETHPLYLGELPFAKGPLAEKLAGHDLVVVIGAPVIRYYPFVDGPYLPDGAKLWQVTDDPQEAARAPVGESLRGDAVLGIEQLIARVA